MSTVEGNPSVTPNTSGNFSLSVESQASVPNSTSKNLRAASTSRDSAHSSRVPGATPSSSNRSQRINGQGQSPGCLLCNKSSTANLSLSGSKLDNAYREVFYRAMEIVTERELQELGENGIPFCQTCRDKVVIMFSIYNTFQDMQKKFEAVRNDLAFTTIVCNPAEGERPGDVTPGPMNDIRSKIINKWMGVYEEHLERHQSI